MKYYIIVDNRRSTIILITYVERLEEMTHTNYKKINKKTLSLEIYEYLRNLLSMGELKPGTRLLESEIAKDMAVSRAPVREALRKLEADGLVDFRINQGATVRKINAEEIWQIYSARYIIEGYLVMIAAEQRTPDDLIKLRRAIDDARAAVQSKDIQLIIRRDLEIHRIIWDISKHDLLRNILLQFESQILMIMNYQMKLFANEFDGTSFHEDLFDSISKNNGTLARTIIQKMIEAGFEALVDDWQNNHYPKSFSGLTVYSGE